MTKTLQRWLWKRRKLRRLADEAFEKEAMAEYSRATIEDVQSLKHWDELEKGLLLGERGFLNGVAATGSPFAREWKQPKNEYEKEKRLKEIVREIAAAEGKVKSRDEQVRQLQREVEVLWNSAVELWNRRKVFKERF